MPEDHSRLSTRRKFLGVSGAALAAAAMGLKTGEEFVEKIYKKEAILTPF